VRARPADRELRRAVWGCGPQPRRRGGLRVHAVRRER